MRDLHHKLNIVEAIAPATYSADQAGAVIDRLGYGSLAFALSVGAGGITFSGSNKIEFVLEHSEDNSVWTDVPAAQVVGVEDMADDGIVKALKTAHAAATVTRFGYIGDARYIRLTADYSGTHGAGTPIAAVAILGRGQNLPAA